MMAGPTLPEWEQRISSQLHQIELLGELDITQSECSQLAERIAALLPAYGPTRTTQILGHKYPCSFAAYLVAQGIYGYQGGDYWSGVCEATGLPHQNWPSQWGQQFERFLRTRRLVSFDELVGTGGIARYVGRILAHGGIPNYCLHDFFANMLVPAVQRGWAPGSDVAGLIEDWCWRGSARYVTDKPVLHFLEAGGTVAEDFVERALEMAYAYDSSGVVPTASELGLPLRVVAKYQAWADRERPARRSRGDSVHQHVRIMRPELLLDPWGEGLCLSLPPQRLGSVASWLEWRVLADGSSLSIAAAIDTGNQAPVRVLIDRPARGYEIVLLAGGQAIRSWQFHGVTPERPVAVFDDSGRYVSWRDALPARTVWIVRPSDSRLEMQDGAHAIEVVPRLPAGWSEYTAELWDLHAANAVSLVSPRGDRTFAVRPDEVTLRPHFSRGRTVEGVQTDDAQPVYVDAPPAVRITLAGDRPVQEELARWRLSLRPDGASVQDGERSYLLSDIEPCLTIGHGFVEVPLASEALLGPSPFGRYMVRCRGPLGRDASLQLAIVPHLHVAGHDVLAIPDPSTGPQPVSLSVVTPPEVRLTNASGDGDCSVEAASGGGRGGGLYRVLAAPDTLVARLKLEDGPSERTIAIQIPLRRMRWGVSQTASGLTVVDWTTRMLRRSQELVDQADSLHLLVEVPGASGLRGRLSMVDADWTELQRIDCDATSQLWRFNLNAFRDSLAQTGTTSVRLVLALDGPGPLSARGIPLLELTKDLAVEAIGVVANSVDEANWSLDLTWSEITRLRSRVVRFWSTDRPWAPCVEGSVDDGADGRLILELPKSVLPAGNYRIEIAVVDPWAAEPAVRPRSLARNTSDVTIGAPQDVRSHVDALPHTTLGCVERALAGLDDLDQKAAVDCLNEAFSAEDVGPATDALLAVSDDLSHLGAGAVTRCRGRDGLLLVQRALRNDIQGNPRAFLAELARRTGLATKDEQERLRQLVVEIGMLDRAPVALTRGAGRELTTHELAMLWHFWAPIALLAEQAFPHEADDDPWDRARLHLGDAWFPVPNVNEFSDSGDQLPALVIPSFIREDLFRAPQSAAVEVSAGQLKAVAAILGLVPLGLLDADSWTEANLSWLLSLRTSLDPAREREIDEWVSAEIQSVASDLDRLCEGPLRDATTDDAVLVARLVRARHVIDPVQPLRNVGFLSGATALVERCFAYFPQATQKAVYRNKWGWRELALRALEIAPGALTFDLCLCELGILHAFPELADAADQHDTDDARELETFDTAALL